MIYYILAFLIFFFSVYDISLERDISRSSKRLGNSLYIFFTVLLIVLGGIRWQTGTDWLPYYNYFISHKTWQEYNSGQFEIVYAFLNFSVRFFSSSYTAFLCIFSFIVIFLKSYIIKKIAIYPALSFFLFFCTNIGDINAVRQALAVSILLSSIYFIHKKDKMHFLILLIIATSIHNSAILWIFSYYIYHKHISNTFIIFMCILCLAMGLIGERIYISILNIIFMPLGSLGRAMSKIVFYINNYEDIYFSYSKMFVSIMKRFLFIPIFLIIRQDLDDTNEYIGGLLNLFFWGNIIYLLFTRSLTQFQRMTTPYVFTEIFILPAIIDVIRNKKIKYLCLCVILIYGLFKLFNAIQPFVPVLIPYYTIFSYKDRM
jgi:hypothetical protein